MAVEQGIFESTQPSASKLLSDDDIRYIKELTQENNIKYINFFETYLKPKQHFIQHYSDLIRNIVPLKNIYVMKQEMYYRELRRYINQSFNRINLPLSVLLKNL